MEFIKRIKNSVNFSLFIGLVLIVSCIVGIAILLTRFDSNIIRTNVIDSDFEKGQITYEISDNAEEQAVIDFNNNKYSYYCLAKDEVENFLVVPRSAEYKAIEDWSFKDNGDTVTIFSSIIVEDICGDKYQTNFSIVLDKEFGGCYYLFMNDNIYIDLLDIKTELDKQVTQ